MDPERWKEIKDVSVSRPWKSTGRSGRPTWREACAGDESLREEVEALLVHQTEAEGFLKDPAMGLAAKALAKDLPTAPLGADLGGPKGVFSLPDLGEDRRGGHGRRLSRSRHEARP